MADNTSWGLVGKGSALCFAHGGALIAFSESVLDFIELSHLPWEDLPLLCGFGQVFLRRVVLSCLLASMGMVVGQNLCPCPALRNQQAEVCVQRSRTLLWL